jgi:multicomponent Na+:H+ antiporter subunit D
MVKIWNEAFWKQPAEVSNDSASRWNNAGSTRLAMLAPIAALATITVTIGLAAEPFVDFSIRAAHQLLDPQPYIQAVLGVTGQGSATIKPMIMEVSP